METIMLKKSRTEKNYGVKDMLDWIEEVDLIEASDIKLSKDDVIDHINYFIAMTNTFTSSEEMFHWFIRNKKVTEPMLFYAPLGESEQFAIIISNAIKFEDCEPVMVVRALETLKMYVNAPVPFRKTLRETIKNCFDR